MISYSPGVPSSALSVSLVSSPALRSLLGVTPPIRPQHQAADLRRVGTRLPDWVRDNCLSYSGGILQATPGSTPLAEQLSLFETNRVMPCGTASDGEAPATVGKRLNRGRISSPLSSLTSYLCTHSSLSEVAIPRMPPRSQEAPYRQFHNCTRRAWSCGYSRRTQQSVRNGQGRYLEKYLERTGVERYREVSVYTGVYQERRDTRTRTRGYISRGGRTRLVERSVN
jgi:hypothetical protein